MTDPQAAPLHPYGPDAPTRDYVGLAFSGILFGVTAGTGLLAGLLWVVRQLQARLPAGDAPDLDTAAANLLLYGTVAVPFLAGLATFAALRPIGSAYRQGGLGMVAAFGSMLVAFLTTIPAERLAGPSGLLVLVLVSAIAARALLHRMARQRDAA